MLAQQLPVRLSHDNSQGMVVSADKDYRTILLEELELRSNRNNRYSLRAFARFLGLTSARLSEILNRKSGLSREAAAKIAKRLDFSETETEIFCDLVESEHARSPVQRKFAKIKLQRYREPEYRQLQMDAFRVVADWYCFAILELAKLDVFQNDENWIAKALSITPAEAKAAVERLQRLNLLELQNDKLVPTENFTASPSGVASDAIKKFHQQILKKALASLTVQPLEARDYAAAIMRFNVSRLPEAKAMLKEFRRKFGAKMSDSVTNSDVYCLSTQFFNLTPALTSESTKK